MATTMMDKIVVQELTKFGFKVVGSNDYINYSKNLLADDKARVVPGANLEVEFYVADSGKRYLNKVVAGIVPVNQAPTQATPAEVKTVNTKKSFTPKYQKKAEATSAGLTKDEWAAKDQRISRQGVIQAAVIALAPVVSLELLPVEAVKLAETMLKFVNP